MQRKKKKYEMKLAARISENREFLLSHLQREWDEMQTEAQKAARKERMLTMAKKSGMVLGQSLLILLLLGGVLAVGAAAPNVFSVFGKGKKRRYHEFFDKKQFRRNLTYLKRHQYVKVEKEDSDIFEIKLTEFGSQQVLRHAFGKLKIPTQSIWDKTWRVVIFDVPNKHKWARDGLRDRLKIMGFYSLQKSVFVFPYPCWEEVRFVCAIYNLEEKYIKFIETQHIYSDTDLRKHFLLDR